jgi:pimeloyl-ACP methyl ester carboxylesterase
MAEFSSNGVSIYYEVTGQGFPLVWSHTFSGSYRSWEPQARFFARRYQVITYSDRGYPPSEVPSDPEAYSQDQSVGDLYQLLRHLNIEQAYIGGLSMGGALALSFGIAYPEMCRALIIASAGSGTTNRDHILQETQERSDRLLSEGIGPVAGSYSSPPFERKDPRGFEEFIQGYKSNSASGSALTLRGVQMKRPTIYDLEEKMRGLRVPTLVMIGDEDEPCIEPAVFMKRHIPSCGLSVFPQSGHTINQEEPDLFNRTVLDFLTAVKAGGWAERPV